MLRSACLIVSVVCSVSLAASVPAWMSSAEMIEAFQSQTIAGVYPDGLTFEESYDSAGRLTYTEPGRSQTGQWSAEAGVFCTIYDESTTGGCYRVQQVGANCFQFHFISASPEEARNLPVARPAWTARAWVKDRGATCDEEPAV
jgi:hypothetical protein